ncbi:MAG TPA: UDP-N-acetylmuramoyl-L-alanyl-D-glutamate--2,6-diaminopimelate ligase, partial [Minicystis sp.]|nr:UDP-N-acetylmuramoyl-L-alanyl-D-glutamate--2,6-diaminopimelate ligase [Minicystis sp.]
DNPRSEDPAAIADAIAKGAAAGPGVVERVPDRAEAIARAVRAAAPADVVVIAGKGHETVQIVGDAATPFDDARVAAAVLGA